MLESQRMVVSHDGRDYMRIQVGDSFKFIDLADYDGPRPSSTSSTPQVQEDHVSTSQRLAQSHGRDDDIVFVHSQSVRAPSANELQPQSLNRQSQRLRNPVNHERTPTTPSILFSSTKRKHAEIDDDVVDTPSTQNAKRVKKMRGTPSYPGNAVNIQYQSGEYPVQQTQNGYNPQQYAEAAHYRQPRHYQEMHSAQNIHHLQQPAYPADAPELQPSSQIYPPQQTQHHHYGVQSTDAGMAQSHHPEQTSPSPQVPTHQEWLLQQPHPLQHIYSQQETHLPQHQHHVQQTYSSQKMLRPEQVHHSQDVQYQKHKYQSPSASHSDNDGSNQVPGAPNVQQYAQMPRQSSLAASTASRASDRPETSASTRQETSAPGAMQGDASVQNLGSTSIMPKPVMRADSGSNTSATALADQSGRFDQASTSLGSEMPPHPVPSSLIRSVKESTPTEGIVMPPTTTRKRKLDLEENGYEVTEAPTKRRKTAVPSRTQNGEQDGRCEEVHARSPRHESISHVNENTLAEDPGSAECALKYFTPWQLAMVGPDSLMAWFTAKQLRSHFSPIILRQIFSDGHLNLLGMSDILEYPLPEGTVLPSPGTPLEPALFETPQLLDSELEEIQQSLFASIIPEEENHAAFGDGNEQSPLVYGEMSSPTIDEDVGAGGDPGQSISVHGYIQAPSVEEAAAVAGTEQLISDHDLGWLNTDDWDHATHDFQDIWVLTEAAM